MVIVTSLRTRFTDASCSFRRGWVSECEERVLSTQDLLHEEKGRR